MQVLVHRPADLEDRAICWWTRGEYSHALVIIDGTVFEAVPSPGVHEVPAGVYFRTRSVAQYEIYNVPGADDASALAFARTQLGKRYDWRSIIGFATLDRGTRERAGYWMCAEFAVCVCAAAGVYLFSRERANPAQISPSMIPLSPVLVAYQMASDNAVGNW